MSACIVVQEPELLSCAALLALLGKKHRNSVYELLRSDPSFPRPIAVGSKFRKAWRRAEVMRWINAQKPVEFDGLSIVEQRQRAKREREAQPAASR